MRAASLVRRLRLGAVHEACPGIRRHGLLPHPCDQCLRGLRLLGRPLRREPEAGAANELSQEFDIAVWAPLRVRLQLLPVLRPKLTNGPRQRQLVPSGLAARPLLRGFVRSAPELEGLARQTRASRRQSQPHSLARRDRLVYTSIFHIEHRHGELPRVVLHGEFPGLLRKLSELGLARRRWRSTRRPCLLLQSARLRQLRFFRALRIGGFLQDCWM
mmetsp:Transcript_12275/g.43277  ORF Transcript_12275/g.43277 Transcript_12275/m.43277 type:complete len:216 (-) Transcript_12275:255-902(-)